MAEKKKYQKGDVVNMNYPPDDMSIEEQERFWGEVTEEDKAEIEAAQRKEIDAKYRSKPRPV